MGTLGRKPGESWKDVRIRKALRRQNHVEDAILLLSESKIPFTIIGEMFLVKGAPGYSINFWPKSGRYKIFDLGDGDTNAYKAGEGFGIKNMIATIKSGN